MIGLILYGCGGFLNDYEGIKGYEDFKDDLALMYFVDIEPASEAPAALAIVPLQIRKFRLVHLSKQDVHWVQQTLDRESQRFGAHVMLGPEHLALSWSI